MKSFLMITVLLAGVFNPIYFDSAQATTDFSWKRSLPITYEDPSIGTFGGTELRAIVAMDGKLYASNGYWRDTQQSDPAIPGPQIFVLDSPSSSWRVDLDGLNERVTRKRKRVLLRYQAIGALYAAQFHSDANGQALSSPQSILFASVWDRIGSLTVFTKMGTSGQWLRTPLVPSAPRGSQIRSFGFHRDTKTGIDRIFAGTDPFGIVSGAFDPTISGGIKWDTHAEPGLQIQMNADGGTKSPRVMGFTEANGKLYTTLGWDILERQDGQSPSWVKVFSWPGGELNAGSGGLRGITAVPGPSGTGQLLLVAVEGNPFLIERIDPQHGFSVVEDLNISSFLTNAWGTETTSGIAAYNDMTYYPDLEHQQNICPSLLIGFEARTPGVNTIGSVAKNPDGHFLVRDCHGNYAVKEIVDPLISPQPALVSTRTMALSPFPSDPDGTIYAGGFDAGNIQPHNTAWLYKGVPAVGTPAGAKEPNSP